MKYFTNCGCFCLLTFSHLTYNLSGEDALIQRQLILAREWPILHWPGQPYKAHMGGGVASHISIPKFSVVQQFYLPSSPTPTWSSQKPPPVSRVSIARNSELGYSLKPGQLATYYQALAIYQGPWSYMPSTILFASLFWGPQYSASSKESIREPHPKYYTYWRQHNVGGVGGGREREKVIK